MRKILSLVAAVAFFAAAHAQSGGSKYAGEASIGGLGYRDNAFAMVETVHGGRLSQSFFVGGGARVTYHGQRFVGVRGGKDWVNTAALSLFGDVKFYLTPERRFCPYVNLQAGAQAVFGPSSSPHYSMESCYVRPMAGGGIGCIRGRFSFGVYVAVNFEVSEGGIKLGLRF